MNPIGKSLQSSCWKPSRDVLDSISIGCSTRKIRRWQPKRNRCPIVSDFRSTKRISAHATWSFILANGSITKIPTLSKTNQLLPTTKSSNTSNRKNFGERRISASVKMVIECYSIDQLTTSAPQGAKRPVTNRSTGRFCWQTRNGEKVKLHEICLDTEFKVSINTGKSTASTISPEVQVQLHGDKSVSGKILLHQSELSRASASDQDKRETFSIRTPDIGNVRRRTRMLHDGGVYF